MNKKKGQAKGSSAGTLVGIIVLLIIFYILFLPPAERSELLGEEPPTNGVTGTTGPGIGVGVPVKETLLSKNIGRIDITKDVLDRPLPNVYISQITSSQEIARFAPVYVKNGVWDKKKRNVSFVLEDIENIDNAFLSFTAMRRKGVLTIKLNGVSIFDYALTRANVEPINLDKSLLKTRNVLEFEVSGVGYRFWKTNEYSLEDIKIIADITDISQQRSRNVFTLTEAEYANIASATLKFIPYCTGREPGRLMITVNNKNVFSAIPVCDDPYFVPIAPRTLSAGDNYVIFSTEAGSYSVEQIQVDFQTKETKSVVYYFEMDRALFTGYEEVVSEAECGEIDGYCPVNCDEDRDKDCCFAESSDNYWCDVETDDADDRCVSAIDPGKCGRCSSGYEDYQGEPPENCEGLCGDDKDNSCPIGCSIYYDKDCCYEDGEDNYWCEDIPLTGLSSVCEASITSGECDDCVYGYRRETGGTLDCDTGLRPIVVEEYAELKDEYTGMIYIEFVDDLRPKRADLNINGHYARIDQDRPYYSREISYWLEPDNNYIEIYPLTTLDIVKLEIKLE